MALSNAERQARHREKMKAQLAAVAETPLRNDGRTEKLAKEIEQLRDLVINGGSRDGILDDYGEDIGGHVFVISAAEDAMRTCMIIEPFWPLPEDHSTLRTFLGWNRAEWKAAPPVMIKAMQMDAAVALWEVEWQRTLQPHYKEPGWPPDPIDCLRERYRRAGIPYDESNVLAPGSIRLIDRGEAKAAT